MRWGTGIVLSVAGLNIGEINTWTDVDARDPELLYVYRVRALYGDVAGQWSSFVISGIDQSGPGLPATPVIVIEPTAVVPEAPVEPTAALPEPEPTEVVEAPPVEPTAALPEPEPTEVLAAARGDAVGQVEDRPVAAQQQAADQPRAPTAAPPQPEPTRVIPQAPVAPTAALPEPEPTASA